MSCDSWNTRAKSDKPTSYEQFDRDAMDLVHPSCPGHHLDPRDSQSYRVPKCKGSFSCFHTRVRVVLRQVSFLQVWGLRLIWWSIWLSVVWGGTIIRVIS